MPRDSGAIQGNQVPVETVIAAARRYGCKSISYTYTEPTIFFEYTYDVARLAHESMLANVYVTNGYMTPEMLEMVTSPAGPPLMDAANVDLKSFRDEFYRKECGASLQPVLDSLKMMKQRRVWVEVTTLVIPMLNDSDGELQRDRGFHRQGVGNRDSVACQPLSPHLSPDGSPADAREHGAPRAGDRPGGGAAVRVRGKYLHDRGRGHRVPRVQTRRDPPFGVQRATSRSTERSLSPLRVENSGAWEPS